MAAAVYYKIALVALVFALVLSEVQGLGLDGKKLKMTRISTAFPSPIAVAYHEPTASLVMTANYYAGTPNNFVRVDFQGNQYPFSTISGLTDEVKLATVRSGNPAGFKAGDLFGGTGVSGHIIKVTDNGNSFMNPWCQLGDVGLMRGSLHVDTTGVFNYELVVVTTSGYVFQVDAACAHPKQLGYFPGIHLEGLYILPNDPRYGPLAGKALVGAEQQNNMYAIGPDGSYTIYSTGSFGIEDIDLIIPGENFFGINFGTGYLLGASADQFLDNAYDVLITCECGVLYILTVSNGQPVFTRVILDDTGADGNHQWEHVTFSPGGIREILPGDFSLCITLTAGTSTYTDIKPLVLDASLDVVSNYHYSGGKANPYKPTLLPNAINVFLSQDYTNDFGLTLIADNGDSTGGQITLIVETSNIGAGVTTKVQDDPLGGVDTADTFIWDGSKGRFSFKWAAGSTDGVALDPLDFVTIAARFNIKIYVDPTTTPVGITEYRVHYTNANGVPTSYSIPISTTLEFNRASCSCNNGVVDKYEDCDGGTCCTSKCSFKDSSVLCNSKSGFCDVDDYCTGASATCPANYKGSNILCRAAGGDCDISEYCTGSSPTCPSDSMKSASTVCRRNVTFCDATEYCTGSSPICPADVNMPNGTPCDDTNACTTTDQCDNGVCVGTDTLCSGVCGDGVVAQSEQCDNTSPCCYKCKFAQSSILCRASTGICDPSEYCTGTDGLCPTDINDRCPICDNNCNNNGLCIADGVCNCTTGYTGGDCSIPLCEDQATCGDCAGITGCTWCCEANRCLATASNETCDTPISVCTCPTTCLNGGVCTCGSCSCLPGYTGIDCGLQLGCDNQTYAANDTNVPRVDVCNVCQGDGKSCLGCDGIPFGAVYDRCGVCGGDGSSCYDICPHTTCSDCASAENCVWCASTSKCLTKVNTAPCEKLKHDPAECVLGLSADVVAGLSAGVIGAIAAGAVVGALVIGFSGKKGYDAYIKNKSNFQGAQNNPMYNDNGLSGNNPFYDQEMKERKV